MEKLRIGQEFEVVEVISNVGALKLKGNTGVVTRRATFTEVVCNGAWDVCYIYDNKVALMRDNELKPIGKLRITKLK